MDDRVSVPEHCSGLFLYGMVQIGPWVPPACYAMNTMIPMAGSVKLAPPPHPHSQRLA